MKLFVKSKWGGMNREWYNKLSKEILGVIITLHREMGCGMLEVVYELCLLPEIGLRGMGVG